ncbi:MAG TPA: hypothetical protein VEF55_09175 [Candidatus Binatia bacterium]|nr:hypothetical protein [Candidatus Binatia bacterium]
MRFAVLATAAAAAVAAPLAVAASGPQMSSDQFLNAVRCTAYENLSGTDAGLTEAKWQLNAEARRQPAETAAQALAEVSDISRQAYLAGPGALTQEKAAACARAQLAAAADSRQRA